MPLQVQSPPPLPVLLVQLQEEAGLRERREDLPQQVPGQVRQGVRQLPRQVPLQQQEGELQLLQQRRDDRLLKSNVMQRERESNF